MSVEHEEFNSDLFLDVKICLKNEKCVISVSKKPTFSQIFTNYKSFIRSVHIYCDFKTFHLEIEHLFKESRQKKQSASERY